MNLVKSQNIARYLLIPLLLVTGACRDFFDINETPNNPTSVAPAALLPTVLTGAAFANGNELNRFAATVMNYTAGAGGSPAAYDIYNTSGADFGNQWRFELYGGALINAEQLIRASEPIDANAYVGIAKIMKAYSFSIATDVWGDVPYSEALQGEEEVFQPRIDSQEDIYTGNEALGIRSLFDLIREGLADLNQETTLNPGNDDLVYGGNLDNWRRAAHTLMLKLALQIRLREPELATSVMNEVIASGIYIAENAQDFNVRFGAAIGSQSPIHTYTNVSLFRNDLIVSTRFVNRLQELSDPRLPVFVTAPTGEFVTIDNGFRGTLPQPIDSWSRFNAYVTGANGEGPVRLLTNFQRAFILAEAALTMPGVNAGGTAQEFYEEGIRASMQLAGIPAASIDAYIAANPLSGSEEEQLEQIINQKYIAWFGNGLEAWNDWRRTGYPQLPPNQNAVGIDGTRPVRAVYIDQETSRNPAFEPIIQSNVPVWWQVIRTE